LVSRVVVVLSVRRARAALASFVLLPIDRPDATVERCFISAAFFLLHLKVFQVLLWTVVGFFTPVLCFSRKHFSGNQDGFEEEEDGGEWCNYRRVNSFSF
jgi:hypothetical protein